MPKHLDGHARKEWRRLVPILLSMRVLSEADGVGLGILCSAYSTLIQAQTLMLKSAKGASSGLLMKTPSGYVQQSPLLSIINSQSEIVGRQLREFGLTPASRSRIATTAGNYTPGGPDDPLELALCFGREYATGRYS